MAQEKRTRQPIIQPELRSMGVIAITDLSSGWDIKYVFDFADGDHFVYEQPVYRWGESAKSARDLLNMIISAISVHRVIPFIS